MEPPALLRERDPRRPEPQGEADRRRLQPHGAALALAALWVAAACALAFHTPAASAAAAPDPGGDERAAIALPPPDRFFGFNEDVPGARDAAGFASIAQLIGANAVRTTLPWNVLEPARDVWDESLWARWETSYRELLRVGATPIFVLGFAPTWAREGAWPQLCIHPGFCTYPPARSEYHRWRRYVAEAVRRFPRAIFEVWNEPNLARFWQPRPEPGRWAELMRVASEEIRRISPQTTLLACGCATPLRGAPGRDRLPEFMRRAGRRVPELGRTFDGFSFHTYPQGFEGEALRYGAGTSFAETVAQARAAMRELGVPDRELWLTELGLWTFEAPLTEAEQADGLERLVRRGLTMPGMRAVLIHRVMADGGLDSREASMGLLSQQGVVRPALWRFSGIARIGYETRRAIQQATERSSP